VGTAPSVVLFDLGGVLFRYAPETRLRFIAETADLPVTEVQARLFDADFNTQCETGLLDGPAGHAEFCRLLGVDWPYEIYRQAQSKAFEADDIVLGLARELSNIRDVGCLTNNGHVIKDGLAQLYSDFFAIFRDRIYFSADLGLLKPNPEAFAAVLQRWGRPPQDILFVDDTVENVIAAAAAGFHVHRFVDVEALEADLRGFGLL